MKKKLLATDYDGTLRRCGIITKKDRNNITRFRQKGGFFGVVTGRGMNFLQTAEKEGLECDYYVLYNGSLILDGDGNIIKEYTIPRDVFDRLSRQFATYSGLKSFDKTGDEDEYRHYYAQCGSVAQARRIGDEINALFGDEVTAFVNGDNVNIGIKGSSKAQGVRIAAQHFGLSEEDIAVVGDDYNDMDMIVSLNGWAIATGRSAVRKAAPHICSSVGALAKELTEG